MIITPKNWMSVVATAVDDLPPHVRQGLTVKPELLEPLKCAHCQRAHFFLASDGPRCAACRAFDYGMQTSVELSTERPRISAYKDHRIIASAVLLRLPETVNVVVPEAADASFRVHSRKAEHSAQALQKCVCSVVFRALGLVTDPEGS